MKFQTMSNAELLPICDVLFVIFSLLIYFCDVLFSLLLSYSLLLSDEVFWAIFFFLLIFVSSMLCQGFSFKWHVRSRRLLLKESLNPPPAEPVWLTHTIVFVHCLQLGVLWRYLRLFIPVELGSVKEQVRDLCMLRMIHAFVQSTPLLLVQLHLIFSKPLEDFTDLDKVAASFALVSICWSLASFSKNVRRRNLQHLVLTWLGIVSQFFWRLGTVSARVTALSLYSILYGHWVILLLLLHWLTVFLWLISPNNLFQGEQVTLSRRVYYSCLVACVYTVDYINLQQKSSRLKLVVFYAVMLLENLLLVLLWCVVHKTTKILWFESHAVLIVWAGFVFGILFMLLYYRCFHIQVLKQIYGDDMSDLPSRHVVNGPTKHKVPVPEAPGVFNCVLNRAISRKKKKPSTFVPPPNVNGHPGVKMSQPFWKRLSLSRLSDCDSVSIHPDVIKSKLEEKHRKQLMELQKIQEEMRSGRIDALGISTPIQPAVRVEPPKLKKSPYQPNLSYGYNTALLQQRLNSPPTYSTVERDQSPSEVYTVNTTYAPAILQPTEQDTYGVARTHGLVGSRAAESMDGDNDTSDTERIPPDALYRVQAGSNRAPPKQRQSRARIRSQVYTPRTQL